MEAYRNNRPLDQRPPESTAPEYRIQPDQQHESKNKTPIKQSTKVELGTLAAGSILLGYDPIDTMRTDPETELVELIDLDNPNIILSSD